MINAQPIFDPTTGYRIEVRGKVEAQWLQSFDDSTKILVEGTEQMQEVTVLLVYTDQSGMIGLLRRLHGLGMTIQQLQIMTQKDVEQNTKESL